MRVRDSTLLIPFVITYYVTDLRELCNVGVRVGWPGWSLVAETGGGRTVVLSTAALYRGICAIIEPLEGAAAPTEYSWPTLSVYKSSSDAVLLAGRVALHRTVFCRPQVQTCHL